MLFPSFILLLCLSPVRGGDFYLRRSLQTNQKPCCTIFEKPGQTCKRCKCEDTTCPQDDVLACIDGSELQRDPCNGCEFPSCPCGGAASLPCDSGEICGDIPEDCDPSVSDCQGVCLPCGDTCPTTAPTTTPTGAPTAAPQEQVVLCSPDAFECPGGSFVGRDPDSNCEFFPCPPVPAPTSSPTPFGCTTDQLACPDGSFVGRDPGSNCEFFDCPTGPTAAPQEQVVLCSPDAFECPGGSFVGRDPDNNCEFFPCPPVPAPTSSPTPFGCSTDQLFACPDGSAVGRDPANNCEFFPCP